MEGDTLLGVQVINNKGNEPLVTFEVDGVNELAKRWLLRYVRGPAEARGQRKKATKYDTLVAEGLLTDSELEHCIQDARGTRPIGRASAHGAIQDQAITDWPVASKVFGVAYEPFNSSRIRAEALHGSLKREFIEEQGWIPLEESPEGLG